MSVYFNHLYSFCFIVLNIVPGISSQHDKKIDEKIEQELFLNYLSKAVFNSNTMQQHQQRGIEIACISLLPAGSGMGGSSIVSPNLYYCK